MVWQRSSHSPDAKNWTRCVCNIQILESTYISPTQDGDWVQFMARANNATRMRNYEPIAVVLELPEELKQTLEHPIHSSVALTARERFVKEIRSNISNNRAVVIKGCCFSQFRGFSVEDIGMVRPTMSHSVYWHGMCMQLFLST
jgi:hypothetical protein